MVNSNEPIHKHSINLPLNLTCDWWNKNKSARRKAWHRLINQIKVEHLIKVKTLARRMATGICSCSVSYDRLCNTERIKLSVFVIELQVTHTDPLSLRSWLFSRQTAPAMGRRCARETNSPYKCSTLAVRLTRGWAVGSKTTDHHWVVDSVATAVPWSKQVRVRILTG